MAQRQPARPDEAAGVARDFGLMGIGDLTAVRDRAHRIGLPPMRDVRQCLSFLRERRIVLATGRAAVPSLADAVAGRRLRGSWMANPEVHLVYRLLERVPPEEFPSLALVQGKETFVEAGLVPIINRVATDGARVAAAARLLSADARALFDAVQDGPIRMDGWPASTASARKGRHELERQLLVWTASVHSSSGAHVAVVSAWADSPIAAVGTAPVPLEDAEDDLFDAALRSAVFAPQREAARWFPFSVNAVARALDRGAVSLTVGRVRFIAANDST